MCVCVFVCICMCVHLFEVFSVTRRAMPSVKAPQTAGHIAMRCAVFQQQDTQRTAMSDLLSPTFKHDIISDGRCTARLQATFGGEGSSVHLARFCVLCLQMWQIYGICTENASHVKQIVNFKTVLCNHRLEVIQAFKT